LITHTLIRAFGKKPGAYKKLLGAIELMEAATVSFDDIIDGSDLRRCGPTTHKLYGVENAYLAYQAAYNWAYRAVLSPGPAIEDWRREEMLSALSREIFAYGYGQASELYWTAGKRIPSPGQYLNMSWDRIRFLSFNGPFRLGALLGGAPVGSLPHFEAAGSWLGMAYHLHGDELNLFPRSDQWGKPPADDITGGRYTYIYLKAMELSGPGARRSLKAALGNSGISAGGLKNVIDIVRASGAVEENRRMLGVFYRRAVKAIGSFPVRRRYRWIFTDLARYMAYDRNK
ncbi:MAG: polyprenyl synthetase family protein, partial [Elusimicrobiota bacterium]|nr:polyprenyl synthetase family protein [Elusimicrobiota bacterium]